MFNPCAMIFLHRYIGSIVILFLNGVRQWRNAQKRAELVCMDDPVVVFSSVSQPPHRFIDHS